jgi:hypothetical protein
VKKALIAGVLSACASAKSHDPVRFVQTLVLEPQPRAIAIIEKGPLTFTADPQGIKVYRGGVLAATALPPSNSAWTSMTKVAGLDGDGTWIVATDSSRALWRIGDDGLRTNISEPLHARGARYVSAAASTLVVVLDDALIVCDGVHVARYSVSGDVAVAPGRIAVSSDNGIEVWDLARGVSHRYATGEIQSFGFLREQLVAATKNDLLVEHGDRLMSVHFPGLREAAYGQVVVLRSSTRTAIWDGRTLRDAQIDAPLSAPIFAAEDGFWLSGHDGLVHVGSSSAEYRWTASVEPIFKRACASCHVPDGIAGVDLSSEASWQRNRDAIVRRVLVERTMPPASAGLTISEAERATLRSWLAHDGAPE